jgi:uncharacterized protein with ParB-like and HNH nuclease domain
MSSGEYRNTTVSEIIGGYINKNTFLPAIQREFVWKTDQICKLFDSLMCRYPIGSFLFWKVNNENKKKWSCYEFIRDFDAANPHNSEANLDGASGAYFVLDGQQRMTSLYIGLKGSYTFFRYKTHKVYLYLNLLKQHNDSISPQELKYGFAFRENAVSSNLDEYWYKVGDILNFEKAREAKAAIKDLISNYSEDQRNLIEDNLEDLHDAIFTVKNINYYEEITDDYDQVVEIFVRTNTGGTTLGYSDILLSTATAKWEHLNAREEIYGFKDFLNSIGGGYGFETDFVMKGAMYLTDGLPIQYRVSSFTKENLLKIEENWEAIKDALTKALLLLNSFGFTDKSIVSRNAILPIAYYLRNVNIKNYVNATNIDVVQDKNLIQKWFIINTLRGIFGGSSDTTLKICQDVIANHHNSFPFNELNKVVAMEPRLSDAEIDQLLAMKYNSRYSYLLLSLIYIERNWSDLRFAEDHIYCQNDFTQVKLSNLGFSTDKIEFYMNNYNTILNLELLDDVDNKSKNSCAFDVWIKSRNDDFKKTHLIPSLEDYGFDHFEDFINERKKLIVEKIKRFSF